MAEEPAQATPAAKTKAPRAAVPKSLNYQDALEKLLDQAAKAGESPERLLAQACAKRGMRLMEGILSVVFDALEGRKKK